MSRYLYELKNLCQELQDRYGEDDDSVHQVKHELEAVEAREAKQQNMFAVGRDRLIAGSYRRRWEGPSSLLHLSQRPTQL